MGPTVSSMFQHVAGHAASPGLGSSTAVAAVLLLAAAALLVLVARWRGAGRGTPAVGQERRRAGFDLSGALGALGVAAAGHGAPMRVVSRLALGPGRFLCMVEAADRVFLVAVGGEVRLLGELEGGLPPTRRERQAAAERLLAERAAIEAPHAPAVLELVPRPQRQRGGAGVDDAGAADGGLPGRVEEVAERYRTTAAATAPRRALHPVAGSPADEETAFFSQLLEATLTRMEAAEERLMDRPARREPRSAAPAALGALAEAWPSEDAGL